MINSDDLIKARRLLAAFDAESLGEGDWVEGANVLAAMCYTAANLLRPVSTLMDHQGGRLPFGGHFTVIGPRGPQLFQETCLACLENLQASISGRLREHEEYAAAQAALPVGHRAISSASGESGLMPALREHEQCQTELNLGVLLRPVRSPLDECRRNPILFLSGGDPRALMGGMERSHMARPFVHVAASGSVKPAELQQLCRCLMSGIPGKTALAATIRGFIATSMDGQTFQRLAMKGPDNSWLADTLWLADAEPFLPMEPMAAPDGIIRLNQVRRRFDLLIETVCHRRIHQEAPAWQPWSEKRHQTWLRWTKWLQGMECQFPGISGAARPLLTTVYLGLAQLVGTAKTPEGFQYNGEDLQAFCRMLVSRMIACRRMVLESAGDARKRDLALRLIQLLQDSPGELRQLVRHFHRLPTAECREAIELLEFIGAVCREDRVWRLAVPAAEASKLARSATINT